LEGGVQVFLENHEDSRLDPLVDMKAINVGGGHYHHTRGSFFREAIHTVVVLGRILEDLVGTFLMD